MVRRSFTLGAGLLGCWGGVARAGPQRGGFVPIAPIHNSTTTSSEPSVTDGTCANDCSVEYPRLTAVQWLPEVQVTYTTTIVVATVNVIYRTANNNDTSRPPTTETIFGKVPPEYDLYLQELNEKGTAQVAIPLTLDNGEISYNIINYPTPYIDYHSEYQWQGALSTPNKGADPACATAAKPENILLELHPEYSQPAHLISPPKGDEFGTKHVPLWIPHKDQPDAAFFSAAFPTHNAFAVCSSIPISLDIPTQYLAPKFITLTTTIYTASRTEGVIIIQPTATGWDDSFPDCLECPFSTPPVSTPEDSINGPDVPRPTTSDAKQQPSSSPSPASLHIEKSVPGWHGEPEETPPPNLGTPPSNDFPPVAPPPQAVNSGGGGGPAANPAPNPTQAPAATPTFTLLPTVIGGRTTNVPAFVLPSTTIFPGASLTLPDGQITTVSAPSAFFTFISSTPVYIISGTSTASLGQTITFADGATTVLSAPDIYETFTRTTSGGAASEVPIWIISGTRTATKGETVVVGGDADRARGTGGGSSTTVLSVQTSNGRGGSRVQGEEGFAGDDGGENTQGSAMARRASLVELAVALGVGVVVVWL